MYFSGNNIRGYLTAITFALLIVSGSLLALPPQPNPPRLVNDYVGLLTQEQVSALETKLAQYATAHTTQIAVIITTDLYGFTIADFSTRLGTEWGIGTAGSENGAVITIYPEEGNRDVYIAVGYGLEAVIPDITAKRIVENEILPNFRNNDYYKGLDDATTVIMQLASGEFAASEYVGEQEVPAGAVLFPFLLMLLVIFLLSRGRKNFASPGKNIPFWTLFWLLSSGSRGSSGSFGNFSSGRGGFGGGGGGFGGFGGGRFGGGGAGGSW
jgi:uncharacterized protein